MSLATSNFSTAPTKASAASAGDRKSSALTAVVRGGAEGGFGTRCAIDKPTTPGLANTAAHNVEVIPTNLFFADADFILDSSRVFCGCRCLSATTTTATAGASTPSRHAGRSATAGTALSRSAVSSGTSAESIAVPATTPGDVPTANAVGATSEGTAAQAVGAVTHSGAAATVSQSAGALPSTAEGSLTSELLPGIGLPIGQRVAARCATKPIRCCAVAIGRAPPVL